MPKKSVEDFFNNYNLAIAEILRNRPKGYGSVLFF